MDLGRIDKAFISPSVYKTGVNFSSKSEQNRFVKQYDQILKLKHILINDEDYERSKLYTKQLLSSYFKENELAKFSELGIINFQNTVKHMPQTSPADVPPRLFIMNAISQAHGHPVTLTESNNHLG